MVKPNFSSLETKSFKMKKKKYPNTSLTLQRNICPLYYENILDKK